MAKSTSKLFQNEKSEDKELTTLSGLNVPETPADDIQDVDISAIKRKKFRINGDPNKILELNVSDLNIAQRMSVAYDRLNKYMEEVSDILSSLPSEDEEATEEQQKEITNQLDAVDKKMREEVDYIFDAPVSAICADGGSMYDPFAGAFRFEHIIEALSKLYENNLENEFQAMKKKVSARTSKYTKKYHN